MQKDVYNRIISFLQGASWAVVLIGAYLTFKLSVSYGIPFSIFLTLLFILVSLFLILALDAFSVNKQKLEEAKKQTNLLEKIYSKQTS